MRSCSDSIAQLASALAKAQLELVNPVKSLTAVIDRWGTGNEGQSYRYAPLSAGLDIVRKTLCKHELAVIQTTHVDQDGGMVFLTTTLAHGSGEWISAWWPVCRIADMSNPKLMGASLTYARRYGLFTLVGLAGEDDLDVQPEDATAERASFLPQSFEREPPLSSAAATPPKVADDELQVDAFTGVHPARNQPPAYEAREREAAKVRRKRQDAGTGGTSRSNSSAPEDLSGELAAIRDPDALLQWALAILPLRNRLTEGARATLDAAFRDRAGELGTDPELLLPFAAVPVSSGPDGLAAPASA